jgi:hypothetical protein
MIGEPAAVTANWQLKPAGIAALTGATGYVTSNSAVLHGSLTNNNNTVEYGFYWGMTSNPTTRLW